MGKGGSGKQEVTDYYLSIHYGIGTTVDSIHGIYVGEKVAWEGEVSDPGPISINKPNLFGGNKKEGGTVGVAYYLPGRDDQTIPEHLANRVGRTTATMPGYRGVSSLWFHGSGNAVGLDTSGDFSFVNTVVRANGFLWSSNNPYLRDIWMKVRRAPKGLGDALAEMIGTSKAVSVNRNDVTVDGVTATVTQAVASTVNGSIVLLDRKSFTVSGTEIIIDLDDTSSTQDGTVSVGGLSTPLPKGQKAITVNGVTVTINSSYSVTLGPGAITVANFSARFNARVDANPVHIIYECMTNSDWGMGGAPSSFNIANWQAAGRKLFDEGFGMSLTWAQQTTVESFVGEIVDHIQCTIFINPRDGLWTIKLIRDDYNVEDLPVLNRDNCRITNFDRKAWGETTNEISVTWTNPENEEESAVVAQDLANITIQGAVISDSRNYYGIRNAELAMYVAKRDLRLASAPMAVIELEVDRGAWDFVPGGVVVLDYPEEDYDISQLVLRISKIDYGRPGDMTIKVNAVEDIFALPLAAYQPTPPTEWEPTTEDPRTMDYEKVVTAPLYFATEALAAASLTGFEFPEVMSMIFAAQDSQDTSSFDVISETVQPNGDVVEENYGTFSIIGHVLTDGSLLQEATSTIEFVQYVGQLQPDLNYFGFIGNGDETEVEIILLSAYESTTDTWTIERGVLDTVPKAWPANSPVWIVALDSNVFDETPRAGGETVTYKLLPRTSLGVLDPDDATAISATLTDRPWLPNRPGNVMVEGTAFGSVNLGTAESAAITWANRNRLLEPTEVVRWGAGSITPEAGQTTTITVMKPDRTILSTYDGLTGSSFSLPGVAMAGETSAIIRVTAERDGLESLQGHEISVTWNPVIVVPVAFDPTTVETYDGENISGNQGDSSTWPNYTTQAYQIDVSNVEDQAFDFIPTPQLSVDSFQTTVPPGGEARLSLARAAVRSHDTVSPNRQFRVRILPLTAANVGSSPPVDGGTVNILGNTYTTLAGKLDRTLHTGASTTIPGIDSAPDDWLTSSDSGRLAFSINSQADSESLYGNYTEFAGPTVEGQYLWIVVDGSQRDGVDYPTTFTVTIEDITP